MIKKFENFVNESSTTGRYGEKYMKLFETVVGLFENENIESHSYRKGEGDGLFGITFYIPVETPVHISAVYEGEAFDGEVTDIMVYVDIFGDRETVTMSMRIDEDFDLSPEEIEGIDDEYFASILDYFNRK